MFYFASVLIAFRCLFIGCRFTFLTHLDKKKNKYFQIEANTAQMITANKTISAWWLRRFKVSWLLRALFSSVSFVRCHEHRIAQATKGW